MHSGRSRAPTSAPEMIDVIYVTSYSSTNFKVSAEAINITAAKIIGPAALTDINPIESICSQITANTRNNTTIFRRTPEREEYFIHSFTPSLVIDPTWGLYIAQNYTSEITYVKQVQVSFNTDLISSKIYAPTSLWVAIPLQKLDDVLFNATIKDHLVAEAPKAPLKKTPRIKTSGTATPFQSLSSGSRSAFTKVTKSSLTY